MREVILVGAPWCGACKAMKVWFDELRIDGIELRYADIESPDVADEGIASLPAVLFREDGVTVQRLHGAMSMPELVRQVRSLWDV